MPPHPSRQRSRSATNRNRGDTSTDYGQGHNERSETGYPGSGWLLAALYWTRGRVRGTIHAMRTIFTADDCDAVLLVDANNAFNTMNRMTALHNIRVLCPAFATILINTYRVPVNLLVAGGGRLVSKEGTTQGDPLAMGMCALGIQPLLNRLEGLAR